MHGFAISFPFVRILVVACAVSVWLPCENRSVAQEPGATNGDAAAQTAPQSSSMRIVKLLWTAQKKGAATALEKSIDQAFSRKQVEELLPALREMKPKLDEVLKSGSTDVRWYAATAGLMLLGSEDAAASATQELSSTRLDQLKATTDAASIAGPALLLRTWWHVAPSHASDYTLERIRRAHGDNASTIWLEHVVAQALQHDRAPTVAALLTNWKSQPRALQIAMIEPLTQQSQSMRQVIAAIDAGVIAKDMLNTNQLRKWIDGPDRSLAVDIERVWGKLRTEEDADRKAVVQQTIKLLNSGKKGNPVAGQQSFKRICSQCHRLHGDGMEVGPDITANGRGSFEQLVSNVMDPSLVIGKAFLAKTVLTTDGQVLSGIVAGEDEKRLTLKVQGGKLVELNREDDIDEIKESTKSLMPDGLEKQMSEQELLDLFAFLALSKPIDAPENSTIPGTPDKLVAE